MTSGIGIHACMSYYPADCRTTLTPMFERYTEHARRAIFWARHVASVIGSPFIESEHLLLGLLREDQVLRTRISAELPVSRRLAMKRTAF